MRKFPNFKFRAAGAICRDKWQLVLVKGVEWISR